MINIFVMQKTINVIVYIPGAAGNFITLVLSLDKQTYPWIPIGTTLHDDSQRKEFYSFSPLQDSNTAWQIHHTQFNDVRIGKFIESPDYDTMIWRVHPSVYYETEHLIFRHTAASEAKVNFLTVRASPEVEFEHVEKFNERNKLILYRREHELLDRFEKEHTTFKITLDNMFSTEEDFLAEYDKINKFLNLPGHHEDALWLYRDWRKARETARSEAANQQSNELITEQLLSLLRYRHILKSDWIKTNQTWLHDLWRSW